MTISDRVRKSMEAGSWIRKMFEEANDLEKQYGKGSVFDLSIGNPVMEPPPEFKQQLKALAENPIPGMHRYMENAGYLETRAAVAKHISLESGLNFTSDEIIMTCGAAGALNVVLKTILNPGDEVIVFAPFFPEFNQYINNYDGVVKVVPTDEQFMLRLDATEAAIGDRTRAVIINSPNNPSGAVYPEEIVRGLGELLRKKEAQYGTQIFLISDEAYSKIIYDGLEYPQVWPHHTSTIVATSHSKDLALPGERVGYIAIHPECQQRKPLVDAFIHCNRTMGFINAPALMQNIVRHILQVTVPVMEYQKKRDFLYDHLTGMGYSVVKPKGAFYMFPKSPVEDDVAFVRRLQQFLVLTVPGSGFWSPGYFRISYCMEDRILEGSMDGLQKAAREYKLS